MDISEILLTLEMTNCSICQLAPEDEKSAAIVYHDQKVLLFPCYHWMKEIKGTQVNGCIDGLKLCGFIRENYLVGDDQEKRADLENYVNDFKVYIKNNEL